MCLRRPQFAVIGGALRKAIRQRVQGWISHLAIVSIAVTRGHVRRAPEPGIARMGPAALPRAASSSRPTADIPAAPGVAATTTCSGRASWRLSARPTDESTTEEQAARWLVRTRARAPAEIVIFFGLRSAADRGDGGAGVGRRI